jgi:hypothetical protein
MGKGCGRKQKNEIVGAALNIRLEGDYKMVPGKKFTISTSPGNPGNFTSPTLIKINGYYFILSYEQEDGSWHVVLTAVAQLFKMEIKSAGR